MKHLFSKTSFLLAVPTALFSLALGCGDTQTEPSSSPSGSNPFLEDQSNHGKEDSAYHNPDGIEVEVSLEADVKASSQQVAKAPAELAQFAQTYLRKRSEFYLQSVSEAASSADQTEWLVDGTWITADEAKNVDASLLTHFRLTGINAVLLHGLASGVQEGSTFTAQVPLSPFSLYADVGSACAEPSHIALDQSVYWYLWNPSNAGCNATLQDLTVTVSKLNPSTATTYPEYDQLIEDGKVTAVMMFGQVDDGPLEESDLGMVQFRDMAAWLEEGGFAEVEDAPVGVRYTKHIGDVDFEVDLYSPDDFGGLGDFANLLNFDIAVTEHEIVIYQGHSMLGASNLWGTQQYPDSYQIFLYGGCLGYEYYMSPILASKGGWEHLDVVSSVVPVPADEEPGAAFIAKFAWSLDHGYAAAWRDLLGAIRTRLGNSTFGVSGVRDNCFTPSGSTCGGNINPTTSTRYEYNTSVDIPDGDEEGITSQVEVPESVVAKSVTVELDVAHESISDLTFSLEHNGVPVVFWEQSEEGEFIRDGFTLDEFAGEEAQGTWTLRATDSWSMYTGKVNRWALIIEH